MPDHLFHIATLADWEETVRSGSYSTSTRGRTLAEEGFIHASRADQWQGVRAAFYADATEPLVLLEIDPGRLDVPVVEEAVPGSDQTFPHIYGPLPATAVVSVRRLDGSFSQTFTREVLANAMLGIVLIAVVLVGVVVGTAIDERRGPWTGLLAGLLAGLPLVVSLYRRRGRGR
jgi:uncharacterized protein (DUF952 family)